MTDEEYLTILGSKIIELRKNAGLTQEQLGTKVGTNRLQIKRIERGETNSTINMLRHVAAALGIGVEELVKV